MTDNGHRELLPLGPDETPYRHLTSDYVSIARFEGREVLKVEAAGLEMLADQAMRDSAYFLRTGHLEQLRTILDDQEASDNDHFVAMELLKNAAIAAAGILPMCQDTGTAIVSAKKGSDIWTDGGDEAALARGIGKAYAETNLRYSQVSPISMFEEVNTRTNLPAQIEIYADQGTSYKFMFMAKGGGSANKSFLFQETRALLMDAAKVASQLLKGPPPRPEHKLTAEQAKGCEATVASDSLDMAGKTTGSLTGGKLAYPIHVQAGERVQFDLKSSAFDPLLLLKSADCSEQLARNDDFQGRNSRIVFEPTEATNVVLVASGYGGAKGAFSVEVESTAPKGLTLTRCSSSTTA